MVDREAAWPERRLSGCRAGEFGHGFSLLLRESTKLTQNKS